MALLIISQPTNYKLVSAYRPIEYSISWDVAPAPDVERIIYCDIYAIEELASVSVPPVFLRTLTATYNYSTNIAPLFKFDVQDAFQEYLQGNQHPYANTQEMTVRDKNLVNPNFCVAVCKFRYAEPNEDGIMIPNLPQGYSNGLESNRIIVLNANQQQEDDSDLQTHIWSFMKENKDAALDFLILSKFRDNRIVSDYDYTAYFRSMEVVFPDSDFHIVYNVKRPFKTELDRIAVSTIPPLVSDYPGIYPIPLGRKFIELFELRVVESEYGSPLVLGEVTSFQFDMVDYFFVELIRKGSGNAAFTTPKMKFAKCSEVTLRFLNSLGSFDDIHFEKVEISKSVQSTRYQKPSTYPANISDGGWKSLSVQSNEHMVLKSLNYSKQNGKWMVEILDSPQVYQVIPTETGYKQVPVNVVDSDLILQSMEPGPYFDFTIQIEFANRNIRQRS